jgi:hypothetical protein
MITPFRRRAIAFPARNVNFVPAHRQLSSASVTSAKVSVRRSGSTPFSAA